MIWGGLPARIIKAAEEQKIRIIVSEQIIREINQTLAYPKLKQVYEKAGANQPKLVETILRIAKLVEAAPTVSIVREDPADNKFIECAVASEASYIVSGDRHLLRLGSYRKTRIVSVTEFLGTL
jgi:putative PIN family toxin of toxin-antitoxin system